MKIVTNTVAAGARPGPVKVSSEDVRSSASRGQPWTGDTVQYSTVQYSTVTYIRHPLYAGGVGQAGDLPHHLHGQLLLGGLLLPPVSGELLSNIPRLKMSPFQGEKPTNHATVLSIIKRKLGLELPEACCVPR